jgi:ABC-type transport system substrate-binding protein
MNRFVRNLAAWAGMSAAAVLVASAASAETLVVAAERTPDGLDTDIRLAGTQEVIVQTYEGLLRYARSKDTFGKEKLDTARIEPHLAESWTTSDDGKTVTFKLREGVKSAAGNELTSADVVWGYKKAIAQKRTGAFLMEVARVNDVVAIGKYEVAYKLTSPNSFLLPILTSFVPGIYDSVEASKHVTPDDPWAAKYIQFNTLGFGAYTLQSLKPGEEAIYVANPNYFRGKPYYDRVVYRAVPSISNRALLLKSGQVHSAINLGLQNVPQFASDPNFDVFDRPSRAAASLSMNSRYPPFDDSRVREAVGWSIDRGSLNNSVFQGRGVISNSPIPPYIPGAAQDLYPTPKRDVDMAKRLLAEAGHPDGIDVELIYADTAGWEEAFGVQIAAQLKDANIRVKLSKISTADLRARQTVGRRDIPFQIVADGPFVMDALYTMSIIAKTDGSANQSNLSDPALDRKIDEASAIMDDEQRLALTRDIQKDWLDKKMYALVVFRPIFKMMPKKVTGFVWHPDEQERWIDLKSAK